MKMLHDCWWQPSRVAYAQWVFRFVLAASLLFSLAYYYNAFALLCLSYVILYITFYVLAILMGAIAFQYKKHNTILRVARTEYNNISITQYNISAIVCCRNNSIQRYVVCVSFLSSLYVRSIAQQIWLAQCSICSVWICLYTAALALKTILLLLRIQSPMLLTAAILKTHSVPTTNAMAIAFAKAIELN